MSPRWIPLVLAPALLLAGCAGTPSATAPAGGTVRVVASTDVWGDVVEQIGGDAVQVDSIITDPDRDPHEYQAGPRDQLAVSRAQLVVVNGGGYDDFLERLTANAPKGTAVLDAVDESGPGTTAATGERNEHVWYDLGAVARVAAAVERRLARIAPEHRRAFAANLRAFEAGVAALQAEERAIRADAKGKGVAITEPVPLYMTQALGLVNRTPAAFSRAVEEGDDVAPAVLRQQLALFRRGEVALLAYNAQTEDATTDQVLAAARAAGVPAVGVRETLPDGRTWLQWMGDDLAAMRTALRR